MLIALVNSFRTSQPFGKNLVISENSTSEVEKEMAFTLNEADCGHWEHHFKYTSTHNLYTLYKLAELIQSRHKILQSALRLGPKWMKLAFHNMLFPKFFHFSWESSVQKVLCFSIHDEDHPDHCQSCPLNITESAWCIIAGVQPGLLSPNPLLCDCSLEWLLPTFTSSSSSSSSSSSMKVLLWIMFPISGGSSS